MKTQEERILLSILDSLHLRYESILMENAADYTPILESIIEGIIEGVTHKGGQEEIEKKRNKMYRHAREFLLDLCLRNRDYEEDLDHFIEAGTVWIDSNAMS
ncbi:MAG: hypothetical protein D3908_15950 [Candidatus Electrothrix sp. AUS4]|nr:hypothetical protein [Candidatus Electrothrix sp. AUS4]